MRKETSFKLVAYCDKRAFLPQLELHRGMSQSAKPKIQRIHEAYGTMALRKAQEA